MDVRFLLMVHDGFVVLFTPPLVLHRYFLRVLSFLLPD